MNKHTLLIHIGMPKTGTTALQNFLMRNDDKLQKYGWCYPVLSAEWTVDVADCGNAYCMYADWILKDDRQEWDNGMQVILRHLQNKNVIISAEGIFGDGIGKVITAAAESCENVKVIVYLRRQDREVESLYNQHIKIGVECGTFDQYIESDYVTKKWMGYLSKLDSVSGIIGRENLIVRIYEKQQLVGNDITVDFMSVLGIPMDKDVWERNDKANLSIEGNYLEIKRLINSVKEVEGLIDSNLWNEVQADIYDIVANLTQPYKNKREYGFFTFDKRKEFIKMFEAENEQIAREYLNRENGALFYDDIVDYPMCVVKQDNSFEADMIRMFTLMFMMQKQKIKLLLDKKEKEIIAKILMKDILEKCNGRKLLFFGAGQNCQRLFENVHSIPVALIVDNDKTKQGMAINGVRVSYAKDIVNWREYFIIVTCNMADAIGEQLCGFGLKKGEDYIFMREYGL